MPPTRQSRQSVAKIPAKCPRPSVTSSTSLQVKGASSIDYGTLKRTELQQQCKKLGIRATGKNAELIERLEAYSKEPTLKKGAVPETAKKTSKENQKRPKKTADASEELQRSSLQKTAEASLTVSSQDLTKAVKTETTEEDIVQGWCVVHGMILYRPSSSWAPLLLHGGQVYVQDGENLVPFHLPPLNNPVPNGLSDNYICEDCVIRNREKPKCCPSCHQTEGRRSQNGSAKKGSRSSRIPIAFQLHRTRASLLQISDFDSRPAKDRRRTVEIRKLYQPQEDEAYAQRVDGILSQMARGELGMDRALRPLQPLVVHSPSPFVK